MRIENISKSTLLNRKALVFSSLIFIAGVFLHVFFPKNAFAKAADMGKPGYISMVQLLANPEKFNGATVVVVGFLILREGEAVDFREGRRDALYLGRADAKDGLTTNSVLVEVTPQMLHASKELNGDYVIIKGTYNAKEHGYLGLYSGAITRIEAAALWPR